MRKKIVMILICLAGCISIMINTNGFMKNIVNAQSAPAFQLPKGAKVVLGEYDNKDVVWEVGKVSGSELTLLSTEGLGYHPTYHPSLVSSCVQHTDGRYLSCPLTQLKAELLNLSLNSLETGAITRNPFIPTVKEAENGGTLGLTIDDQAFYDDTIFWLDDFLNIHSYSAGTYGYRMFNAVMYGKTKSLIGLTEYYDATNIPIRTPTKIQHFISYDISPNKAILRPYMIIDESDIVFAAATGYSDGTLQSYQKTVGILGDKVITDAMQLRIKDMSLTADLLDIRNDNGDSITQHIENGKVYLRVNANRIQNTHISVLLYNRNTSELIYYQVLEPTNNGINDYQFDLTGIPLGKYNLAVLNENIDRTSARPVIASKISDMLPLEIVEPHKITYTKTPQSGASAGDYEFSKNVNVGQAVGKVTANPTGVTPLTYSLETNGDNSYLNFEIDGLDANGASSNTPLNVKIKTGAPDLVNGGLKAVTYKFCITAVDANGDPVDTSGNPTEKVCTSFTVEKTNPTIAFDDPSTTKKSIADAATVWNETATATPSAGTKITYSITGGDVSLISINPETGAITYTGSNAFGKVKIRATVDDDPTSGNDNFNSAFVEKKSLSIER